MKALAKSPKLIARIAGLVYALVFVTGIYSLLTRNSAVGLLAGVLYVAVTVLFYFIFRPVSRSLSLLAAIVSLAGILVGPASMFLKIALPLSPLVFFGVYCSLIAFLIFKSTFLPRFLSVLMAFAGLGWLTFLLPSLALSLEPYIYLPGIVGEGALTLWLIVAGVDEPRWKARLSGD